MARPAFSPTPEQREQVKALYQARVSLEEIARRLTISKKTLRKHFVAELGGETDREKTPDRVITPPPFEASPEQREVVEILAAARVPNEEIAARTGVTPAILEHHFADELRAGPSKRNSEVILSTYRSAVGGNVSAQRLWQAIISPGAAPSAKAAVKPTLAGKKVEANEAAKTAGSGTEWGNDLESPVARQLN